MAKYILKLDSQYDEHLDEQQAGKQTVWYGGRVDLSSPIYALYPIVRTFTDNGNGNYVFNGVTYSGDGYYVTKGGDGSGAIAKGKCTVLGTETRQYRYSGQTKSREFVKLLGPDGTTTLYFNGDKYTIAGNYHGGTYSVFVETGDTSSVLSATSYEVKIFNFHDVSYGLNVASPIPGVAYVQDQEEGVDSVCYNDIAAPPIQKFSFESAGTFSWQDYGVTTDWFNALYDQALSGDPLKCKTESLWCIGTVSGISSDVSGRKMAFAYGGNEYGPDITNRLYISYDFINSDVMKSYEVKFNLSAQTVEVRIEDYYPD